jgi:hypothetical protein
MRSFRLLLPLALAFGMTAGCKVGPEPAPVPEPAPEDVPVTRVAYVDADGFDAFLETALTNQDPVIVIQTDRGKPDWDGRLNAWIAAWNAGGAGRGRQPGLTARGQSPIVVDGDSIREFRLLVEGLMNRIDDRARERSAWWAEERVRSRRVELLKPYSLRFHRGEDGLIQVILFHGRYAAAYRRLMQTVFRAEGEDEWTRAYTCSACRGRGDRPRAPVRLTSAGSP